MNTLWQKSEKYLVESFLILISVVLAFWFEDLRQDRQDRKNYVNTLYNFRNDLHEDIRDLRLMSDSSWDAIATNRLATLQHIDSLLEDDDPNNNLIAFISFVNDVPEWDDWREPSPFTKPIASFAEYLMEDSLTILVSRYESAMALEFDYWHDFNATLRQFHTEWFGRYNNRNLLDPANQLIANSNAFRFTVRQLIQQTNRAIEDDLVFVRIFSKRMEQLDHVLIRHGIDRNRLSIEHLTGIQSMDVELR